jgi:PA14 domain
MKRFNRKPEAHRSSTIEETRKLAKEKVRAAARFQCEALEQRLLFNAGGGWSGGGIPGSYYTNSTESGTPSFTRTDVRLDWAETGVAPGGSAVPNFAAVGATGWSASWAGNLLPKFSENYTFQMVADGKVNMQISSNGSSWTTLINTTTSLGGQTLTSSSYAMTAGHSYDVKITFAQQNNPSDLDWGLSLRWSSPSTPLETISPANALGVDPGFLTDYTEQYEFANAFYQSGALNTTSGGALPTDSHGNPTEDFDAQIYEGAASEAGTYLITGTDTTKPSTAPTITSYGTGNVGAVTYTASTGVFSANLTNVAGGTNFGLQFTNTAGGVTGLKVMRPTSPGATTSTSPSVIWNPDYEALFSNFSAIRSMDLLNTNNTTQTTWSNRSLPSDAKLNDGQGADTGSAVPLEYLVELCNETGKDLYLNIPQEANNQYITDEAELLKYGSDANGNPYTSPQANPVYAPLNENLHVYIEYSNEVWNISFAQNSQNYDEASQAFTDYRDGNTTASDYADGEAIDYDGTTTMNGFIAERYHAERTVDTSNIFRTVWGNSAMPGTSTSPSGPTIMPLDEWQYGGNNDGIPGLQMVDDYYNNANGNGEYTGTLHPVNYYIWGGGGGWYSGSSNPNGVGEVGVINPLFENGTTGWTFTGTSGIAPNGGTSPTPPTNAPSSTDAAYFSGTATISQQVTVPTATMIQLDFYGAYTGNGDQFNVLVDGNNIGTFTPEQYNSVYGNQTFTPNYQQYGYVTQLYTLGIPVSAGTHTIEFQGLGGAYTGVSFIEGIQVGTEDSIFNGASVTGLSVVADAQLAAAYGLQDAGYEGGYDDGPTGQFGQTNLQSAADLDPRVEAFTEQGVNEFFQDGGALGMVFGLADGGTWSLAQGTYAAGSPTPKEQAYQQVTSTLPAAPTNGIPVAATLNANNVSYSVDASNSMLGATGGWLSWNVLVPITGTYTVTATCSGSGATAELLADGSNLIASGATGTISGTVFLTAGLHGIKIQSTSGAVNVSQVTILAVGAPATPTITSSAAGSGQVSLAWSTVTGATGYEIFYGTNQTK